MNEHPNRPEEKPGFLAITTKFVTSFRITGVLNPPRGEMRNLPLQGIKFIATQSLPLNKVVEVKLGLPHSSGSVVFNGKVVWSLLTDGSQRYSSGVEIIQITSEDRAKIIQALSSSDKREK